MKRTVLVVAAALSVSVALPGALRAQSASVELDPTLQSVAALVPSQRAPWEPGYYHSGFNSVYAGSSFRLGTDNGPRNTLAVPVIEHHAADGYWMIPGVNWNLLNIGVSSDLYFKDAGALIGPGIDLGGPLDKAIIAGIGLLPGSGNYQAVKALFQDGTTKLAIMPMYELSYKRGSGGSFWSGFKGYGDLYLALSKRFGTGKS